MTGLDIYIEVLSAYMDTTWVVLHTFIPQSIMCLQTTRGAPARANNRSESGHH